MKLFKLALKPERAMAMLTMTFASAVSVGLVFARILVTRQPHYGFLVWNLFLAWVPLVLSLFAVEVYQAGAGRSLRFAGLAGAWLLFFPNAPYILTDLVHLNNAYTHHFWADLVLVLCCSLSGLVAGFLSLYLMQHLVRSVFGVCASWFFIMGVAILSGIGIYLGRFLRFNSWDLFLSPARLCQGLGAWVSNGPVTHSLVFPALFGLFIFITYVMLYGLTHLKPSVLVPSSGPPASRPA